ncbi:MAG: hypothetical protein A2798_03410 [Candidatus Levybacteria bacterium RIFCSPHIGHO2_01_FULL_37_17]|nr:MAG: hypothetical protein A2798_03410 [Candidatus Levybacteria bacterium RIFCSPHIGHO2_01_FULL_37_17]OGH36901.1 MAG: hypothetical protein A2959_01400 [Candidatus Levybacteria bacterium RIFCSPLOWO2_01_FULL_38_23]
MTSKLELEIKEVQHSKSPLRNHSLNQRNMKDQRDGDVRAHGMGIAERRREEKKVRAKRIEHVYKSVVRALDGLANGYDRHVIASELSRIEEITEVIPSSKGGRAHLITVVDFSGCSSDSFGEPEFFRK